LTLGIINSKENRYTGKDLAMAAVNTFGTTNITPEQFNLLLDYMVPSMYMTRFHAVKAGKQKFTFSIPNYGGGILSRANAHRPYQREIVNDVYPNVVVEKARQLGFSELMVAFTIWWLDSHSTKGVNALYAFPTLKQMQDFVQMRLNSILDTIPYYRTLTSDVNSVQVKKIRDSYLTFRTSSAPRALEGVNADLVLLDEYDHVLPAAEQSAQESMASSPYKIFRRWSTPTTSGRGIESLFQDSDQREWVFKCTHCNYDNIMKFADYNANNLEKSGNFLLINPEGIHTESRMIEPDTYMYVCQKCGKPLDRWYSGRWVAKYPERTATTGGVRGYRISQMDAVWLSASAIKQAEIKANSKQEFYNYVLGFPYSDTNLSVTEADINGISTPRLPHKLLERGDYKYIVVGIDWGVKHTVVVAGLNAQLHMDIINDFQIEGDKATTGSSGEDIRRLRMKLYPYQPDIIVADIGDSGNKIHDLMNIYGKDKVFGCKYTSSPTSGLFSATGQIEPVWSVANNSVTVDKLAQHKRAIGMIKEHKVNIWAEHDEDWLRFQEHWKHVSIRNEELPNGDTRQIIEKLNGKGDHSASAMVYCIQAMDYIRKRDYESSILFDFDMLSDNVQPEKTELQKNIDYETNGNSATGSFDIFG
jgi:DNA-directed RNA polymerase subunit RPC12/RpoP